MENPITITAKVSPYVERDLDELARIHNKTRSEIIRACLSVCKKVYPMTLRYPAEYAVDVLEHKVKHAVLDSTKSDIDPEKVKLFKAAASKIVSILSELESA